MQSVRIAAIGEHAGREVTLAGWLYNKRGSKKLQFLLVRDGSGIIQAVAAPQELGEERFAALEALTQETSLTVTGTVRADARAPGGYELVLRDYAVVGASVDYPISPKEHGVDFLLERRHLWLRSRQQHALLTVRGTLIAAIHEFMRRDGFLHVDAPIFTPSSVEGTSTLFSVDYYGDKAFLTQSGQLYMEAAAAAFGKVYCFGPTFRAEKSKTRRHLTEFWMMEPEMAYADLDDVMDVSERLLEFVATRVLEAHRALLTEVLERDVAALERVRAPFPRLHYDEAVAFLRAQGVDFAWGGDFGAEDETLISSAYDRPVFVHHFPAAIKAFYMAPDPTDAKYSLSVDCLAPEGYGEIIGGGQRADDLAFLEQRIAEHKLPREPYEWYLDLRRYGSFPHSGFGIGVERTLAWLAGRRHIRECIPFPRMMTRISP
jgi:asparaginyl-tRNA synthetase